MYNITKEDYDEIHKVTELTSDAGEKTRAWVDEKVTFITRKTIVIAGVVLLGVGFFVIGFLGRKGK